MSDISSCRVERVVSIFSDLPFDVTSVSPSDTMSWTAVVGPMGVVELLWGMETGKRPEPAW
ncbi:hypothetical protein [Aquisphaera insulae]|uniref:hypothetical protein n=1 Tax=Aquisphaera insulae TaxID=2712864 RepID=UPI0013ED51C2|nr:hypothetical protein [Aquisphaera insulae]